MPEGLSGAREGAVAVDCAVARAVEPLRRRRAAGLLTEGAAEGLEASRENREPRLPGP